MSHPTLVAEVVRMHHSIGSRMWVQRPLSEQLLQYAAKDILLIGILCAEFGKQGWLPQQQSDYQYLLGQCQRYVSAHRDQGKSAEADIFKPCQIMPLDVLDHPVGTTHVCAACRRSLSLAAYETYNGVALKPGAETAAPVPAILRRPQCRLCEVLASKAGYKLDHRYMVT